MATKSQLKTYFEKGDIPTSTQFGELIDSLLSVPSEDTMDRPNQNLFLVMVKRIHICKVFEL